VNERTEEFRIELLNFPVRLFERSMAHVAAVQREFDVVRVDDVPEGSAPGRLAVMVQELDTRFVGYRSTMAMLDALVEGGHDHEDVVIPVARPSEEIAVAIEGLRQLMDEVDIFCADGSELLTTPTPPDLVAFRGWLFEEVIGQLRGLAPEPWRDPEVESTPTQPTHAARARDARGREGNRLSGALDLDNSGELRESVQAVLTDDDLDLLIDLTDVEFVDSVILSVFVTAHKRFVADDRTVEFVVPRNLYDVMELTGLLQVLRVTRAA
jgi:anti-anti-sigma factor